MWVHSKTCAVSETDGTGETYAICNGTSKTYRTSETDGTSETKKGRQEGVAQITFNDFSGHTSHPRDFVSDDLSR